MHGQAHGRAALCWQGARSPVCPSAFSPRIRRQTFGFIFQQFNLLKGISVIENVMLPAYPLGEPFALLKKQAADLLKLFNLAHKAAAKVEWLSGGEAQRAAIARALVNRPEVIIADEPTAHLDTRLSREFMDYYAATLRPREKPS